MSHLPIFGPQCGRVARRTFLSDVGMGFTGLALGSMLARDGIVKAGSVPAADDEFQPPDGRAHLTPKAKSVIWIFLSGGYSHLETFDPKPALNKYAGKTFKETPFPDPMHSPLHDKRSRSVLPMVRDVYNKIFPLQVGFQKRGESGIEVSDWLPHIGSCIDDLAIVRNMFTTDNDHAAENQIHTGRHKLDEVQPSIGSWVHYGLGSLNENLPQFVVLGGPTRANTRESVNAYYLGADHQGVPLAIDPKNPLVDGARSPDILAEEQRREYELINRLNGLTSVEYPNDSSLQARIRSYELAFRMQMSVPEALNLAEETSETQAMYGMGNKNTAYAAENCLAARRLIERGVRFVQLYPTGYGVWDSHQRLKANHAVACSKIDQPVGALIKDLKQRGLLDDTLIVFCTEFGRTPAVEERAGGTDGRDHHPHGFSIFFAGAGVKKGIVYGNTDELGFHAVEPGHYVTDIHATVMHLMGLDPHRLDVPGRKRLEIDRGQPIRGILS